MQVLYSNLTKKQEQYLLGSFDRKGETTGRFRGKLIGAGATACVYSYSRDKIVRVQTEDYDYPVSAHLGWVKLCLRNRFKCVPKYSFVAVDNEAEPTMIITVTERLMQCWSYLEPKVGFDKTQDTLSRIDMSLHKMLCGEPVRDRWKTHYVNERSIRRLYKRAGEQNVYINDLHSDNFMFRRNGQLVITDPCC